MMLSPTVCTLMGLAAGSAQASVDAPAEQHSSISTQNPMFVVAGSAAAFGQEGREKPPQCVEQKCRTDVQEATDVGRAAAAAHRPRAARDCMGACDIAPAPPPVAIA